MASSRCWCGSNCEAPACTSCLGQSNCLWECSGCTGGCKGTCSGCSGSCTGSCSGCSGSCTGSCSGCSGCSGTCTGTCQGCQGCSGTCTGSCQGCSNSCTGSCSGGCTGSCTNSCKSACNKGCTTTEAQSLASLALNQYIENINVTDIARLAYLEARRRGHNVGAVNFTEGVVATAGDINQISTLLYYAGQSTSTVNAGNTIARNFGQSLIDKAVAAYNQTVNLA